MAVTMPVAALIAPHTWSDTGLFEFTGLDRSPIKSAAEEILAKRLAGWQERYPDVNVRRIVVCSRLADLVKQFESAGAVVLVTGWALVGRSVCHCRRLNGASQRRAQYRYGKLLDVQLSFTKINVSPRF
jgi:hypothetical protein